MLSVNFCVKFNTKSDLTQNHLKVSGTGVNGTVSSSGTLFTLNVINFFGHYGRFDIITAHYNLAVTVNDGPFWTALLHYKVNRSKGSKKMKNTERMEIPAVNRTQRKTKANLMYFIKFSVQS